MGPPRDESVQADILIVDDTPANLRLLAGMLGQRGYQVRPMPSGKLALLAIESAPPDLILLDIRMPEMDGYQVCQRLKADDKTRDIPIIFISALQELGDKVKAFQAGGVDYVTKPFQFEEVLARVETHLALRKLQVQLAETNRELEAANRKMKRELALAGAVQTSFLPHDLPDLPGWQLAVTLRSAGETSGDFYDVQLLPNGRLGLLIADVVGKGVGAALYMALSWTLFRTYVGGYPNQPDRVLDVVNRRLLMETRSNQFVTAFYGVLDLDTGRLDYSSAGHCPPYLARAQDRSTSPYGSGVQELAGRGMPLGMFAHEVWPSQAVQLDPGDVLLLYTDGITEARNDRRAFFGEERLLETLSAHRGDRARQIEGAIMGAVDEFMGYSVRSDDITLAVVVRDL
jgi:sigma-B regulation protein RsbU (phosphoserine phosphatase)